MANRCVTRLCRVLVAGFLLFCSSCSCRQHKKRKARTSTTKAKAKEVCELRLRAPLEVLSSRTLSMPSMQHMCAPASLLLVIASKRERGAEAETMTSKCFLRATLTLWFVIHRPVPYHYVYPNWVVTKNSKLFEMSKFSKSSDQLYAASSFKLRGDTYIC